MVGSITHLMDMSLSKLWDADGLGGLACCSPWCCKESDTTEQLSSTEAILVGLHPYSLGCVELDFPKTLKLLFDPVFFSLFPLTFLDFYKMK